VETKLRAKPDAFIVVSYLIMIVIVFLTLYPFLYIIAVSLSDSRYVLTNQVTIVPRGINLRAYRMAFEQSMFWKSYRNTAVYTVVGTLINLALTCSLAYAISRKELVFRRAITLFIVFTLYFQGGIITRFILVKDLGIYNTLWAVVLPFGVVTYNLILVRSYMQGIPEEIIESVRIDGGNDLRIFVSIIVPLSTPVIATIGLFYAVGHWNEYFWPMILLKESAKQPLQVLLRNMIVENTLLSHESVVDEAIASPTADMLIGASIIIALIPILCVYPFIQRYFVKGAMVGSLKE
jgi:putative aldouronate transport system permease protein